MSSSPSDLITALQGADMLIIDNLHAFQFSLDEQQLLIESMDGRNLRKWQFSMAQLQAASQQADDTWTLNSDQSSHTLLCLAAFSGSNDDDEADDAANGLALNQTPL